MSSYRYSRSRVGLRYLRKLRAHLVGSCSNAPSIALQRLCLPAQCTSKVKVSPFLLFSLFFSFSSSISILIDQINKIFNMFFSLFQSLLPFLHLFWCLSAQRSAGEPRCGKIEPNVFIAEAVLTVCRYDNKTCVRLAKLESERALAIARLEHTYQMESLRLQYGGAA